MASETEASVLGPAADADSAPVAAVITATVSGQRRRKKVSTKATAPSARSIHSSATSTCSCAGIVEPQIAALIASIPAMRHACARQVSGGLYCSGAGSCTGPG